MFEASPSRHGSGQALRSLAGAAEPPNDSIARRSTALDGRGDETVTLLRNLGRRKLRTALTITGITIGIWALVVFGALATKIDGLVAGAHAYFGERVIVSSAAGGGGHVPVADLARRPGRGDRRRRRRLRRRSTR